MQYDAIVIGAGIGGLFSALKLSCAGKRVLLIEKQARPGGYATVFTRRGFTFESALHCVDAMAKGQEIRDFLEETGLDKDVEFIKLKEFGRLVFPEHDFIVNAEGDDFINSLKKSFPHQGRNIDALSGELNKFYRQFDGFCDSWLPAWLKMALVPFIYPYMIKMSLLTAGRVISRFITDDKLKGVIGAIWGFLGLPPDKVSAFYFLIVLRGYYFDHTDYVKGGFIRLFEAMVKRIKESGGEVIFGTAVTRIITEDGRRVKAVVTDKGQEFSSRVVISNGNAIDTLCQLLDYPPLKEKYRKKLSAMEKSLSAFQVYLGLKAPARELGMSSAMLCLNTAYDHNLAFSYNITGDYGRVQLAAIDHAQIDPGLVPPGKGSLLIFALDNYANWENLAPQQYQAKKIQAANQLIARVERYLPGLSAQIEVMEAATPRTMERYSSSPRGAIYGFSQRPYQSSVNRLDQKTKVNGLILSGAWTRPGAGVHGCFVSAMDAADMALRYI